MKAQWRRNEFRTTHSVNRYEGRIVWVKSAAHPDAVPFLKTVIERENLARNYFGSNGNVVMGELHNDSIIYPYLPYPSLQTQIKTTILEGDLMQANNLFLKYLKFIGNLSSVTITPNAFLRFLGYGDGPSPICRCLTAGPIDCTPANILIGEDDTWYLTDHEWMFNFPAPMAFVIYRGITTLMHNLQPWIPSRLDPSQRILFCGFGSRRTYIPIEWCEIIGLSDVPLQMLSKWSYAFQSMVLLNSRVERLRVKDPSQLIKPDFLTRIWNHAVQSKSFLCIEKIAHSLLTILRK